MTTLRTDKKENRAEEKTVASHRIGFKPSLGRRLGMGNRRWWRWFIAPPNERTTAPDKRLVRFVFGHCGLPTNGDVVTEMCWNQAVRSYSDRCCHLLFYRRQDCLNRWKPRALVVKIASDRETGAASDCRLIVRLSSLPVASVHPANENC